MQIAEAQRNQVFNPTGAPRPDYPNLASDDEAAPEEGETSHPPGEESAPSNAGEEGASYPASSGIDRNVRPRLAAIRGPSSLAAAAHAEVPRSEEHSPLVKVLGRPQEPPRVCLMC